MTDNSQVGPINSILLLEVHDHVEWPNDFLQNSGAVIVFDVPQNDFTQIYLLDSTYAASELLGYSNSELKKLSPDDLHETPDAKDFWKTVYNLRENGECRFRWLLKRKDGVQLPVDVTAKIIEKSSSALIIIAIRDITTDENARRLYEENVRVNAILQNSSEMFAIVDRNGILLYISPGAYINSGYPPGTQLGTESFDFIHPDDRQQAKTMFSELRDRLGEVKTAELRLRRDDDKWGHFRVTGHNRLDDHNINGIVLTYSDLTDRKRVEQELQHSDQRFRALIKNAYDICVIVDENGILRHVSDTSTQILGYDAASRIGRDMCERIHPDDVPWMKRFHTSVLKSRDQNLNVQVRIRNHRDTYRYFEVTGYNLLHEPSINGLVLNYHDITEQKESQRMLEYLALHDSLTGLPNRRHFEQQFESQIVIAQVLQQKVGLLYVGVDRFSYINDTFGHSAGDVLLKQVAHRLVHSCGEYNVLVSRVGGDEFSILVSSINDVTDCGDIANSVFESFLEPFKLENFDIYVTVCIGISAFPNDGTDVSSLMKGADIALGRSKGQGASQFQMFSPTMNIEAYKNFVIRNDLRNAISRNELSIAYQPRVQTSTGRIVNAEALLRWNHPEWGAVSPKDFIPIAEDIGVIVSIGEWVLRTVCTQNKLWQDSGLMSIPISVNFSGMQFLKHDFIQSIEEILKDTGLEGEWLEIEVTESVLLENEELLCKAIECLQQMGIQTAIDDFGTGYSSLSRLKNSRMNTLKIDRSFVHGIESDSKNATITESIIQMAHGLGMTVVAEGVETEPELKFLRDKHCDQIQGYLFSRPVPADEFETLLRKKVLLADKTERYQDNKRRYFRIKLPYPLHGAMTISSIHGKAVTIGSTQILVDDMGPGGFRFITNIRLPISPEILLRFDVKIYENVTLHGQVVWGDETDHGLQVYGVKLLVNDAELSELVQHLNKLAIELRQDMRRVLPHCEFYQGNIERFFQGE